MFSRTLKDINHFWLKYLENVSPITIQTDFSQYQVHTATSTSTDSVLFLPIEESSLQILSELIKSKPEMIYITLICTLLYRYTHQTDLCIGVEFDIGIQPVRIQFNDNTTFNELLNIVSKNYALVSHHALPLKKIKQIINLEQMLKVCFFQKNAKPPGYFNFSFAQHKNQLQIDYNQTLFKADSIQRLAQRIPLILNTVAEDPQCLLRNIPILLEIDKNKK